MSHKKKNKKSNTNKTNFKKNKNKLWIIIILAVVALGLIAVVVGVTSNSNTKNYSELTDFMWSPSLAKNSSGDEADMSEVYNTKYSSFKGSLTFKDDGTFSIWLSPGAADDGTHTGRFSLDGSDTIDVVFDDSTKTEFKIIRKGSDITSIVANYNGYDVYFSKQ